MKTSFSAALLALAALAPLPAAAQPLPSIDKAPGKKKQQQQTKPAGKG